MNVITKVTGAAQASGNAQAAQASSAAQGLPAAREASAEQCCLAPAEANAGSAACEGTPNPAEHGLKRRRYSDETPRPTAKLRAAGMPLSVDMHPCRL